MNNPFQTRKFKQLQSQWYSKLKDAGFEDIEDTSSPDEMLKSWHSSYFEIRHDPEVFKAKQFYYAKAEHFHTQKLERPQYELFNKDDMIWDMHMQGVSIRDIALKLELKIWKVHRVISILKSIMLSCEES